MKTKLLGFLNIILYTAVCFLAANSYALYQIWRFSWWMIAGTFLLFAWLNIFPVFFFLRSETLRLRTCAAGCRLLSVFLCSSALSIALFLCGCFEALPIGTPLQMPRFWVVNSLIAIVLESVAFWNGIIRVYIASEQLGIKIRVIGIACGLIPLANLIALGVILHTVSREVVFENSRIRRNASRREQQVCATKYPLLMVHGVFFRDYKYFNYWGRIPKELELNGAKVYYGNHQSAASVEDSGKEIADRIIQLVRETGCEKVNVIAHSKGGLDSRAALMRPDVAEYVASLTTVNTPHRGCEFADYLLTKIPEAGQQYLADRYNMTLRKLGDPNPDFLGAVNSLTAASCRIFNENTPDAADVYYQSVGSTLKKAGSGRFPMNFTYHLAKYFDGPNDGLVSESSFPWGQEHHLLTARGNRGISHIDIIDLNRKNIPGFDVREFYVQLVKELKDRGF